MNKNNIKTRAGFISLIGRPNVGKSSLMNKIIGQKISIISPKVQTTRHQIRGVYNYYHQETEALENTDKTEEKKSSVVDDFFGGEEKSDNKNIKGQAVFLDSPGIHKPLDELGEYCWGVSKQSIKDSDLVVFMIEAYNIMPDGELAGGDAWIYNWLLENKPKKKKVILLVNKIDLVNFSPLDIEKYQELYSELYSDIKVFPVSAKENKGIDDFLNYCYTVLPQGEIFFPDDDVITDRPMRFIASEMIRENVLNFLEDELPHSIAVEIDTYRESSEKNKLLIKANVIVERHSQKLIVVGKKGHTIKGIGMASRKNLEELLGESVYLELTVKVAEKWRKKKFKLKEYGYN